MSVFKVDPPYGRTKAIVLGGIGKKAKTRLGKLAEFGPTREVWLDLDSEHVVAIVGKRGSGKTHSLGVLIEGLSDEASRAGVTEMDPSRRHAVVVFDTLNLFQWVDVDLSHARGPQAELQRKQLVKWGMHPVAIEPTFWHPLGCDPANPKSIPFSIKPSDLDAHDWGRLFDVDVVAEPMGQLVSEVLSIAKQQRDPSFTLADFVQILRTNSQIAADFSPETVRALRQRWTAYAQSSVFDHTADDWTAALNPGQVAVFLLGRVPEDLRTLFVFLVIRKLLEARSAASETAKHTLITGELRETKAVPPTWLVIDEAQNIMPARQSTAANDILTRFVREGRNFGLSLAVTTQQPTSIDQRILAQVDTLIAHNLTVKNDLNYILNNLKSAEPRSITNGSRELDLDDVVRQLPTGHCMISASDSTRVSLCEIRPRLTVHGGFET